MKAALVAAEGPPVREPEGFTGAEEAGKAWTEAEEAKGKASGSNASEKPPLRQPSAEEDSHQAQIKQFSH